MTNADETSHQPHRRVIAVVVMVIAIVAAVVPATLAWMASLSGANASDTEEVGLNRLGAATLDVAVGTRSADGAATAMRAENLAPGDEVTGELEISNEGSLPLRYAVTVKTDGGELANWLVFDAWTTTGACGDGITAASLVLRSDLVLASTDVALAGDPATGAQEGDRVLAPGATETLCIGANLPLDAPNEAQGLTLGFDLIVDAEHDLAAQAEIDAREAGTGDERRPS